MVANLPVRRSNEERRQKYYLLFTVIRRLLPEPGCPSLEACDEKRLGINFDPAGKHDDGISAECGARSCSCILIYIVSEHRRATRARCERSQWCASARSRADARARSPTHRPRGTATQLGCALLRNPSAIRQLWPFAEFVTAIARDLCGGLASSANAALR